MKYGIYTIKDMVADECGPAFSAKNDEVAGRNFRDLMKREKVIDESEYRLYRICSYDSEKMVTIDTDTGEDKLMFVEVNVKSWKQVEMEE